MQVTIIILLILVLIVCIEAALEDTAPDTEEAEASPPLIVFSEVVSLDSDLGHEAADTGEAGLEAVLAPQVAAARCHAHCSAHWPPGDRRGQQHARCVRVCRLLLVSAPAWANICHAPGPALCGPGCRVACSAHAQLTRGCGGDTGAEVTELSVRLERCLELVWAAEEMAGVVLVAAKDGSGMLNHVATVEAAGARLLVAGETRAKADTLEVLLIGQRGVRARSSVKVTGVILTALTFIALIAPS